MIPRNWEIHPLYCYFNERKNRNFDLRECNLLSLSYGNIIKKDINTTGGLLPASFNTYNIVKELDIIIRPTDLQNDKKSLRTGLVKEQTGIITSAYIALKPRECIYSKYFHYLLHSYDVMKVFYNMGNGVRQGLNYSEFSKLILVSPPLQEQQKIADFLDHKCSEIDALASDIQTQIETLEEYKKSVITEAVTKGLDPNVEMRDSGIEWIGKIPADWNVTKIKYLFSSGKGLSITKADLEDNGLPVISYGQIHSKENTNTDIKDCLIRFVDNKYEVFKQCKVNQYDFVFADTSEDYDGCGNCCYKRDNSTLYAGYHSIVLHSFKERDNRFLAYLFKTDSWRKQLRETASGVKVFSITQKKLINTAVILPPENQRIIIADFLDHKCSEIDQTISEKQQQLETLAEYKKSLIYEYVTGKKEVA